MNQLQKIRTSLYKGVNDGESFGYATALPFVVAALAEENASTQLDPEYPMNGTQDTMAHRLVILRDRITFLKKMLDENRVDSLAYVLADDSRAVAVYGPELSKVDSQYLNRNLAIDTQNINHDTYGMGGACRVVETVTHYVKVSGSREDGYQISPIGTIDVNSTPHCWSSHPVHAIAREQSSTVRLAPPELISPPAMQDANSIQNWNGLFVTFYIPMQQEYGRDEEAVNFLPSVVDGVSIGLIYLEDRLKTLEIQCHKMVGIDCSHGERLRGKSQ